MSREEIIMELEKIRERRYVDYTVQSQHALDMAIKAFVDQPEKLKGHWITYKDEHRCSKCRESVVGDWYYEDDYYDYCPWCGAEMDGEDK